MALIKFKIDDTNPAAPVVLNPDVVNLHPGDRLLFVSTSGADVLVDLGGDETTSSLVALVKLKGPPDISVLPIPGDGRFVVKLRLPAGGNGPGPDPP